jgi:hypothetical protein
MNTFYVPSSKVSLTIEQSSFTWPETKFASVIFWATMKLFALVSKAIRLGRLSMTTQFPSWETAKIFHATPATVENYSVSKPVLARLSTSVILYPFRLYDEPTELNFIS